MNLKHGMSFHLLKFQISFFWLCPAVCGILVPQPGIETTPPVVEARSLNHWTAREVHQGSPCSFLTFFRPWEFLSCLLMP